MDPDRGEDDDAAEPASRRGSPNPLTRSLSLSILRDKLGHQTRPGAPYTSLRDIRLAANGDGADQA